MDKSEEKLVEKVKEMLMSDELTGRPMSNGCTDGFDTHYVLLAQAIVNAVKGKGGGLNDRHDR